MNNKISNPFLKQLISEIANNANKGRLDLSWEIIEEAKKKKKVKEADAKNPTDPATGAGGGLPPLGGANETPAAPTTGTETPSQADVTPQPNAGTAGTPPAGSTTPPASGAGAPPASGAGAGAPPASGAGTTSAAGAGMGAPTTTGTDAEKTGETGSDAEKDADSEDSDTDKAKEDAAKAKAELEKAKAEKNKAEKEIKKQSYIDLKSSSGTQFLLKKIVNHAFRTNTIDALASELVDALNITTPEDIKNFSNDVVTYMNIPGMPNLISSMKTLANKEPEETEEEPAA